MATQIQIKRGSTTPAGLTVGESAMNTSTNQIYLGGTGGTVLVGGEVTGGVDMGAGSAVSANRIPTQSGVYNYVRNSTVTSFNGLTGAVGGVCAAQANTFTALNTFNAGISAAGGVTLAGTFSGATGSFSKLLTLSNGLSAAGGVTFSSAIVLPINTAPALTIGTNSTKNLILSCVDGAGLIEVGGNSATSLGIRQESGGPVTIGTAGNPVFITVDESNEYIQIQNISSIDIGDGAGEGNGTYLSISDSATTITATCGSFGVNGRLDMNGGYSEAGATATQATNTITFNAALGNTQKFVPSAVVNTVNFTNIATTSTQCTSATLIFLHGATPYGLTTGTFSVQLAGVTKTVKWSGGSAPTLTNTANKTDILNFLTYDGGTTWLGFVGGMNF